MCVNTGAVLTGSVASQARDGDEFTVTARPGPEERVSVAGEGRLEECERLDGYSTVYVEDGLVRAVHRSL